MNLIDAVMWNFMNERLIKVMRNEKVFDGWFCESLKYSKSYYEYLRRSLSAFGYTKNEFHYLDLDWEYFNGFKKLLCEVYDREELLKRAKTVKDCVERIDYYDREVRRLFIADWTAKLTKCEKGVKHNRYAILVQALQDADFRNPGRGQAIACSLYTNRLRKLYKDYRIGYVYDLTGRDIILASTRDASSNFKDPSTYTSDDEFTTIIGSACGQAALQGECFMPFDEFEEKCSPDELSEIIFDRSSWENQQPTGIFIDSDRATKEEHELVELASKFRRLPVFEQCDGVLEIYQTP